ncbi:MAG: hypothetical protein HDT36_00800 [Clostridiales bacterium]|nr:hypothetical protein [Clostridiales bacterium]
MKVIGIKIIDHMRVPKIVECTTMEVEGRLNREKFNPNDCRILMHTEHPNLSHFIIKTEKEDSEYNHMRCYKWLTAAEADAIMSCAAESDVIDLRKLGDYQICSEGRCQSVFIMNDVYDDDEGEIPILVKIAKDDD